MRGGRMREFWDERALEDPYFYVDNQRALGESDARRFWENGVESADAVLAMAGIQPAASDRVVEIGCGVGRVTRALAERVAEVVAIDISERMLALAREHNGHLENVTWLLGDGESLAGVADESVDGCFSHVVFQHVPEPRITLGYVAEMGRVLRTGGWAAFQVSDRPDLHRLPPRNRIRRTLSRALGRPFPATDHPAWRGSAVDLDRLRSTAQAAGLEVARVDGARTQFCIVGLRKSNPTS